MKPGKSVNLWMHNLSLGGSLLHPVFQRAFMQKWEKLQFWQLLCYLPLQTGNDTPPSPLISVYAFRISNTSCSDPCFSRTALSMSDMKRQETSGWGSESLPVWYEKKPRSVFVPRNQGFSGKSGETQGLVCIVSWSLFRRVKGKVALKQTVSLPDTPPVVIITNTHLHCCIYQANLSSTGCPTGRSFYLTRNETKTLEK